MPNEEVRQKECVKRKIPKIVFLICVPSFLTGVARDVLKLYYNELANPNAKVSYKLDGVTIEPKDNTLEFPEFEGFYKRFRLEVYIDEGEGREWEILYPSFGRKKK